MRKLLRKPGVPVAMMLLAAGCTANSPLGADDAPMKAETVQLKTVALANPQTVLSRPTAPRLTLINNTILPTSMVNIEGKGKEQKVSLGGTELVFSLADSQTIQVKDAAGIARLERPAPDQGTVQADSLMGLRPVTVKLNDGREYMLAFPYGYVYEYATSGFWIFSTRQVRGMVAYRSGAVQQAMLGGQSLCLYDSNTDGFYRLGEDSFAAGPADQSVNVFAPLGKLVSTGTQLWQIENLTPDGGQLQYVPYTGGTGKLAVATASPDLQLQVAMSCSAADLSLVASVGDQKNALAVVAPGKYDLLYGLVYSPGLKKIVASVAAGKMAPANVAAEQVAKVELGGPLSLTFTTQQVAGKLTVSSTDFHLTGKSGEEYANYTWKAEPLLSLSADGKTVPLGKMEFGWGGLCTYSGGVPQTNDPKATIKLTGNIEGLGAIEAETLLKP